MMRFAIVVPVFNEEKHIGEVLKSLKAAHLPVVVVDDGSTDKTKTILTRAKISNPKLKVFRHAVNLGKGAAMKTGCEYAFKNGFDAVIFFDSDNQHLVSDLNGFIGALHEGSQIVYGSRNMHMGMPFIRYIGNKAASILVNLLFGVYISDILCGFRAITKKAYNKIKWESAGYGVETEMIIRAAKSNVKYGEVPVQTLYHDQFKGVSIFDAMSIFLDIIRWRVSI